MPTRVDAGRTKMRYAAGIVLDMVGGRNLQIKQEPNSLRLAPRLVDEVWAVARSAQCQVVPASR